EWTNVLGLSTAPTTTTTVSLNNHSWTRQSWRDSCGFTVLDAWAEQDGPHGTDANLNATNVIPFLGLDQTGPIDSQVSECDAGGVGGAGGSAGAGGVGGVGGSGAGGSDAGGNGGANGRDAGIRGTGGNDGGSSSNGGSAGTGGASGGSNGGSAGTGGITANDSGSLGGGNSGGANTVTGGSSANGGNGSLADASISSGDGAEKSSALQASGCTCALARRESKIRAYLDTVFALAASLSAFGRARRRASRKMRATAPRRDP
ncbi:MAG TPA: hypothetical protein VGL13_17630, partial [Polyangiaceae bacterium]